MFTLTGKYNSAAVYTDNCDSETCSQLMQLLNQEFVTGSSIKIMPDTHAGTGCVIGTTMTITDKVVPNLVGVDIGCGMLAVKLSDKDINLDALDCVITNEIPSGFSIHDEPTVFSLLDDLVATVDFNRAFCSLGTLGGGNHFIEVDKDSNGDLWLVIHTGSRHLGVEVCKYYQNIAVKECYAESTSDKIQGIISSLKAEGRQTEIEHAIKDFKATYNYIPKDLCYVSGESFDNYIHDMKITQEYATLNRMLIMQHICNSMNFTIVEYFSTIHNYIDIDSMILRKGSISAEAGETVIIPMNMRDGTLLCRGKGNPDWNYSAPHGAGRIMSRSQAKEAIPMEYFIDSMKDVYSTSVCESTIDESPFAYKPMDEIMSNIKDTVEVIDVLKPIYNFKAH